MYNHPMMKKTFLLNIIAAVLVTALLLAACGGNGPAGQSAADTLPEMTLPDFGPDPWGTAADPSSAEEAAVTEEETPGLTEEPAESTTEPVTETESETETETEPETETETETQKAEGFALAADDLPDNIWAFRRGRTYYLGAEKKLTTGLAKIGGKSYFFDKDGVMAQDKFVQTRWRMEP